MKNSRKPYKRKGIWSLMRSPTASQSPKANLYKYNKKSGTPNKESAEKTKFYDEKKASLTQLQ